MVAVAAMSTAGTAAAAAVAGVVAAVAAVVSNGCLAIVALAPSICRPGIAST